MTEQGIKVLQAALPSPQPSAGGDDGGRVPVSEYEEVHPSLILPPYLPSPDAVKSKVQVSHHYLIILSNPLPLHDPNRPLALA